MKWIMKELERTQVLWITLFFLLLLLLLLPLYNFVIMFCICKRVHSLSLSLWMCRVFGVWCSFYIFFATFNRIFLWQCEHLTFNFHNLNFSNEIYNSIELTIDDAFNSFIQNCSSIIRTLHSRIESIKLKENNNFIDSTKK